MHCLALVNQWFSWGLFSDTVRLSHSHLGMDCWNGQTATVSKSGCSFEKWQCIFSFSVKQIPFETWAVAEVHHNDAPCEMY